MSKVDELSVEGLRLIDSLIKTNSLKKTADELHLTTSSASRLLVKLRGMFDDELFTRQGSQMLPTAVGLSIKDSVRQSLNLLEGMTQQTGDFDPKKLHRTFKLSMNEQVYAVHFIPLCQRVLELAPHVKLELHELRTSDNEKLKTGGLDLILAPLKERFSEEIASLPVFDMTFKLLMRRDHPLLKDVVDRRIDYRDLSRFKKMQVIQEEIFMTPDGIDSWIMKDDYLSQETVVWVPLALPALEMLQKSDFTLVVYSRFADMVCAENKRYRAIALDPTIASVQIGLKWYKNFSSDVAGQWFRSVAAASLRETTSTPIKQSYYITSRSSG